MRIVLICNAGMSTTLLANSIKEAGIKRNLEIEVYVYSEDSLHTLLNEKHVDIVLLGPQVKYLFERITHICANRCPVSVIDVQDYGLSNGDAILNKALEIIEKE